jgi:hypothetical protein
MDIKYALEHIRPVCCVCRINIGHSLQRYEEQGNFCRFCCALAEKLVHKLIQRDTADELLAKRIKENTPCKISSRNISVRNVVEK